MKTVSAKVSGKESGKISGKVSTKRRILEHALTLFSEKGFDAVSVGQIADAVGIKAPSLYKHYKSKQDIFDAILDEMAVRYQQQTASMQMNGVEPNKDIDRYKDISEEQLIQMGKELFLYFLHDEYVCKFRKLLTIEQYHSMQMIRCLIKVCCLDCFPIWVFSNRKMCRLWHFTFMRLCICC